MLEVDDLHAYYGKSHILQGVTLRVGEGEIVSLLGRNGAGRSTAVKTIMGQVRRGRDPCASRARASTGSSRTRSRARAWVMCRRIATIFPALTVRENLLLGMKSFRPSRPLVVRRCVRALPACCASAPTQPAACFRAASSRLLTICRTLMGDPDLIMIDEPTEGLAPRLVERVRRVARADRRARRCDPADRAEADDRARDLAPALRDGTGTHRVRRQRTRIARQSTPCARNGSRYEREATIGARYELNGRLAVITLDNPPVNGLGHATRADVLAGIDRATDDAALRRHRHHRSGRALFRRRGHPRIQYAQGECRAHAEYADPGDRATAPSRSSRRSTASAWAAGWSWRWDVTTGSPAAKATHRLPEVKLGLAARRRRHAAAAARRRRRDGTQHDRHGNECPCRSAEGHSAVRRRHRRERARRRARICARRRRRRARRASGCATSRSTTRTPTLCSSSPATPSPRSRSTFLRRASASTRSRRRWRCRSTTVLRNERRLFLELDADARVARAAPCVLRRARCDAHCRRCGYDAGAQDRARGASSAPARWAAASR